MLELYTGLHGMAPHIRNSESSSSSLTSGTQRQRHGFPPFPVSYHPQSPPFPFLPRVRPPPPSPSAPRRRVRRRVTNSRSLADSSQAQASVHPRARQGRWRTRCTAPARSDPGTPYRTTSAASRSILCTPRNWIGPSGGF